MKQTDTITLHYLSGAKESACLPKRTNGGFSEVLSDFAEVISSWTTKQCRKNGITISNTHSNSYLCEKNR